MADKDELVKVAAGHPRPFDPVVPERGDDPQSSRGQRDECLQPYQDL
jgi:hypothetical protein